MKNTFTRGNAVITCKYCGIQTRKTGDARSVEDAICDNCYDLAGIVNAVSDSGDAEAKAYEGAITYACRTILSKGGKLDSDALHLLTLIGKTSADCVPGAKTGKVTKVRRARKPKHGGAREGAGAKPMNHEAGQQFCVTLTADVAAMLRKLGGDNLSRGIAMAAAAANFK